MLVLVGVTINFALNGGIINKAKEAGAQTQIAADREALLSCVIASMGLDGKVDFTDLDTEVAKIGFTGSNGTYTSKAGNVFTVDADGNILSEGESSGGSSQGGGSSSADTDLAYLQNTLVGQDLLDVCDPSGGTFNDPEMFMDYMAAMEMGSLEESNNTMIYPMLYKGKSYSLVITIDPTVENENGGGYTITGVTENTSSNSNTDLNYLRTFIGKQVKQVATVDSSTDDIVFNDTDITMSSQYSGTPTYLAEGMYMIYISYNGNDYSLGYVNVDNNATSIDDYLIFAVVEGIYEPETPSATE